MKVSELLKILRKNGCFLVEHGKEHDKWHSPVTDRDFRIPRHTARELATGTLNAILKDAGIKIGG